MTGHAGPCVCRDASGTDLGHDRMKTGLPGLHCLAWPAVLVLTHAVGSAGAAEGRPEMRDVIGVNHINSIYHLTDKDFINEGADRVLELGSRVIKLIIRNPTSPHDRSV